MELEVVIQTPSGRRTSRLRSKGPVMIGRDEGAVLRLESDLVSRRHAVVEVQQANLRVEDRSTNGTLVGEQVLHKSSVDVPYGTPIGVGEFTIYISPVGAMPPHVLNAPPPQRPAPPRSPLASVHPAPRPAQHTPHFDPLATHAVPGGVPSPPVASAPPPIPVQRPPQPSGHVAPPPPPAQPAKAPAAMEAPAAEKVEGRRGGAATELRREIHQRLIENLDLATMDAKKLDDPSMRPKVIGALRRIVDQFQSRLPPGVDKAQLVGELVDEALGLGPLEHFLADPAISEIMVIDADNIYVERNGKVVLTESFFTDDERVRAAIERIVTPLGRRIDESQPLVDARLPDGSRVNAVIRPIALRGSCITIRKFSKKPLTLENLYKFKALTPQIGRFLTRSVIAKRNVVISGGTGSGKTTLLNILSGAIPSDERIVTIEDAAELQLRQPHVVSLETKPANMEGVGEFSIRDLLKNAMRMRPDRIVVGECRGGEALDMLQAMNTGHDGSLTTTHANSPAEAINRLETLALMSGLDLPARAIREQIATSIHLIVQQTRLSDGSRKVTAVSEVVGIGDEGAVELLPIFRFERSGTDSKGKVLGEFKATGYLPSYLNQFIVMGLVKPGEPYV